MTGLLIAKVTVLFAGALLVTIIARRAAAETRHRILAGAQLAALALPLLAAIVPQLAVIPAPAVQRVAQIADTPAPDIETGVAMASTTTTPRSTRNVLALLWLTGCAIIATARVVSLARAARIVRRAPKQGDLLLTDEVEQPSTLGRWILLPRAAISWRPERLRAVMLHEEAHVARHDTLIALIGDAACAVYWFHPLAWLVARRARLERERACDDRVLAAGVAPADYATAMLDVARTMSRRSMAVMAMAERSQLEQRIRAILDPALRRRSRRAAGLAVFMATLAAAPLLAALTPFAKIPRPLSGEPDLRGDAIASPFSERINFPAQPNDVEAAGPDAALIALMIDAASRPPRGSIDFVPERARWALSRVRDGELVAPLIESLRDDDWRIRAYATWALGWSGDARATPAIMPLLSESNWRVRAMAAHAIANLGDPVAKSVMLEHLDDPAWQVRTEVVHYLAATGGDRATFEAMREDRHMAVRAAAERALSER